MDITRYIYSPAYKQWSSSIVNSANNWDSGILTNVINASWDSNGQLKSLTVNTNTGIYSYTSSSWSTISSSALPLQQDEGISYFAESNGCYVILTTLGNVYYGNTLEYNNSPTFSIGSGAIRSLAIQPLSANAVISPSGFLQSLNIETVNDKMLQYIPSIGQWNTLYVLPKGITQEEIVDIEVDPNNNNSEVIGTSSNLYVYSNGKLSSIPMPFQNGENFSSFGNIQWNSDGALEEISVAGNNGNEYYNICTNGTLGSFIENNIPFAKLISLAPIPAGNAPSQEEGIYQVTLPAINLSYTNALTTPGDNCVFWNISDPANKISLNEYPVSGFKASGNSQSTFNITSRPITVNFEAPLVTQNTNGKNIPNPEFTVNLNYRHIESDGTVGTTIHSLETCEYYYPICSYNVNNANYNSYSISIYGGNSNYSNGVCANPFTVVISKNGIALPSTDPIYNNIVFYNTFEKSNYIVGADPFNDNTNNEAILNQDSAAWNNSTDVRYGNNASSLVEQHGGSPYYLYSYIPPSGSPSTQTVTACLVNSDGSTVSASITSSEINYSPGISSYLTGCLTTYTTPNGFSVLYGPNNGSMYPDYIAGTSKGLNYIGFLEPVSFSTESLQARLDWANQTFGYLGENTNISSNNPFSSNNYVFQSDAMEGTSECPISDFCMALINNTLPINDFIFDSNGYDNNITLSNDNSLVNFLEGQTYCATQNMANPITYSCGTAWGSNTPNSEVCNLSSGGIIYDNANGGIFSQPAVTKDMPFILTYNPKATMPSWEKDNPADPTSTQDATGIPNQGLGIFISQNYDVNSLGLYSSFDFDWNTYALENSLVNPTQNQN